MVRLGLLVAVLSALAGVPFAAGAEPPAAAPCSSIAFHTVAVDSRNDEWTSAQIKVQVGDLVIVMAQGEAVIGAWFGKVGPNGHPNGPGRLEMKIGTGNVATVGEKWVGEVEVAGAVKFRIHDTDRKDDTGGYGVGIIVIPKGAVPPPKQIEAE
jgi:hypothetical protein